MAFAYPEPEKGGRGKKGKVVETTGFSRERLQQARPRSAPFARPRLCGFKRLQADRPASGSYIWQSIPIVRPHVPPGGIAEARPACRITTCKQRSEGGRCRNGAGVPVLGESRPVSVLVHLNDLRSMYPTEGNFHSRACLRFALS